MFPQGVVLFVFILTAVGAAQGTGNATQVQKDSCHRGRCLAAILDGLRGSYQLLPGVNISSSAPALRSSTASEAFTAYLRSLTLHIALYNEPMVSLFSGVEKVTPLTPALDATGRAKRPHVYSSRFRFLSLYTVFAVGFALLSALVGKAVTLSVIALVIAGIAAVRGAFGFGANSPPSSPPIFDIVRRPHVQVTHTQSAEEVYEAPGSSGGGVSFVYPIRGRAVPTEDSYSPHISVESERRSALRHTA